MIFPLTPGSVGIGIAVFLHFAVCQAGEENKAFSPLESQLEKLRVRWRVPGMSGAIASNQTIIWTKGFGCADVKTERPATPDTVYHLASLTKPFAAAIILQLVQEGKLDLETPVTNFGINLKANGEIRVKHLLTHTSEQTPGTVFRYSGDRFGELTKAVAKVSGQSFAQLLSERILEPLQLTNTAPNPLRRQACLQARRDPDEFWNRLASAYSLEGNLLEHPKYFSTAAGLVSTTGDMARFSMAWDRDLLLHPQTKMQAFNPFLSTKGKKLAYGYGWFIQERKSTKLVWHYGWGVGNSTLIINIPERKLTFILLGNSEGLSRKFDMGQDNNVRRSPFARAFLEAFRL